MNRATPKHRGFFEASLGLAIAVLFMGWEFFGVWETFGGNPTPWFFQLVLWPASWVFVGAQGFGNPWPLVAVVAVINGALYGMIGFAWELGTARRWLRTAVVALVACWLAFVIWIGTR